MSNHTTIRVSGWQFSIRFIYVFSVLLVVD
uniref:Uncharacterized protein n=1 Tax=Rhizophora mucronata TaxID=61149 RepID=A0A2P2NSD4_RHIMU